MIEYGEEEKPLHMFLNKTNYTPYLSLIIFS